MHLRLFLAAAAKGLRVLQLARVPVLEVEQGVGRGGAWALVGDVVAQAAPDVAIVLSRAEEASTSKYLVGLEALTKKFR